VVEQVDPATHCLGSTGEGVTVPVVGTTGVQTPASVTPAQTKTPLLDWQVPAEQVPHWVEVGEATGGRTVYWQIVLRVGAAVEVPSEPIPALVKQYFSGQ